MEPTCHPLSSLSLPRRSPKLGRRPPLLPLPGRPRARWVASYSADGAWRWYRIRGGAGAMQAKEEAAVLRQS